MPIMNRIRSFLASPQGRRAVEAGGRAVADRAAGRRTARPARRPRAAGGAGGLLARLRRGI
jgi:hypothetical protein